MKRNGYAIAWDVVDKMGDVDIKLTPVEKSQCLKLVEYFEAQAGGDPVEAITSSPMAGKKHGTKSRLKRAKEIRRSHAKELQAVGLLPIGSLFWLWWSSPIGWRFLLNWILEILEEIEEQ